MEKQTEETKLKRQIKDYLKIYGFKIIHNLQGLGCYPGLSDWLILWDGSVFFIEIKTPKGKQSENQQVFESLVNDSGCYYYVFQSLEDAMEFKEIQYQKSGLRNENK
jgi:hypothetical protein